MITTPTPGSGPENPNETLAAVAPPAPTPPVRTGPSGPGAFGDYEVLSEIGAGGMGRVFKAKHRALGQFVAVKVLNSADEFDRERFRGEAQTTARLEHPNIVRVLDVQTPADARPYLVMEFADGGSLDRELAGQPQNPYRAAEMMETLARAVHFAHEHGVLHRDLKPANVLRARDGTLKLTDFGLAKQMDSTSGLTRTGALLGTPSYMAPEQADGRTGEFGRATDVYGLGAILYEMLTGRPPFRGVTAVETLDQVRRDDPAPPSRLVPRLPRDLTVICLKCLQKAPARRYATAGELADDLRRWLKGEPIVARPAPWWERLWRQVCRRPWQAAAGGASALVLVLLVAGGVYLREQRVERLAEQRLKEEQERKNKELHEQVERSRTTFESIRGLLMNGELRATPGLTALYVQLTEFYRGLFDDLKRDPQTPRPELARQTFEIGEMAHKVGLSDTALWAFGEARALYTESGDEPAHRARAGEALVRSARVLYDLNRLDDALARCAEAEAHWAALAATDTERDRPALQLAELEHVRGEVFGRKYQLREAIEAYTKSVALREALAGPYRTRDDAALAELAPAERARAVGYLRELGRGYGYRGDAHLLRGATSAADRDYWDSHRARKLVFDLLTQERAGAVGSELETARFQLGRSFANHALFQTRHRAYSTARQFADEALAHREQLVRDSPNHAEYRLDLIANLTEVVELSQLEGRAPPDRAKALAALGEQVALVEGAARDLKGRTFRTGQVLAEARLARAGARAGDDPAAARADLAAARAFLDEALKLFPNRDKFYYQRAAALALAADLDAAPPGDPRWGEAVAAVRAALEAGFRERHPADLAQVPHFRALAGGAALKELAARFGN